jgi:hypothetical protein
MNKKSRRGDESVPIETTRSRLLHHIIYRKSTSRRTCTTIGTASKQRSETLSERAYCSGVGSYSGVVCEIES